MLACTLSADQRPHRRNTFDPKGVSESSIFALSGLRIFLCILHACSLLKGWRGCCVGKLPEEAIGKRGGAGSETVVAYAVVTTSRPSNKSE